MKSVRGWIVLQLVAMVVWVAVVAVLSSGNIFLEVAVGLISIFGLVFVFEPRRSWWGDAVRELAADPQQVRGYLVRMTVAVLVIAVVVGGVVGLASAASGA